MLTIGEFRLGTQKQIRDYGGREGGIASIAARALMASSVRCGGGEFPRRRIPMESLLPPSGVVSLGLGNFAPSVAVIS